MSLPKFGVAISPFIDILEGMKNHYLPEFDFLEIPIQEPLATPEILLKNKNKIMEFVTDNDLFLLAHPPHWNEISTYHHKIRKAWLEEYKHIIDVSHQLEVKKIVVHPHFLKHQMDDKTKKRYLENNIETLRKIVDYAKNYNITVVLENEARPEKIVSYGDFRYIVDNVKGIKINLDIGHAFIFHNMKNVMRYLQTLNNKIDHLHFHDNRGGGDEHLPIGVGGIDYNVVVNYLKRINYDKTIAFEIFTKDKDYVRISFEKIKEMWGP